MLMLTACFDAAGKAEDKNTPLVLVAGLASFDGVWRNFEDEWNAVLKHARVSYFHPMQFAHAKGEFANFEGDEVAKRGFASRLMDVIEKSGLRKFGGWVKKADLRKGKAAMNLADDTTVDPYVLCARSCVDDLSRYALGEGNPRLRTIFDKGDSEDLLRKHCKKHGLPDPEFAWSKSADRKGTPLSSFIGLQAAGWLAWEYYVDACRVFGLVEHPPSTAGRAPFAAFERIPGHIKIVYASDPREDIWNRSARAIDKQLGAALQAANRLSNIKPTQR